jgi:hypothetical protein
MIAATAHAHGARLVTANSDDVGHLAKPHRDRPSPRGFEGKTIRARSVEQGEYLVVEVEVGAHRAATDQRGAAVQG